MSPAVALDMTFGHRNRGGSGTYARSLLASLRQRDDLSIWEVSGPKQSDFVGTMRWLVSGARKALESKLPELLHCPSFVAPWRSPVPFVVTVHDAGVRRFPADHPVEWRAYDRAVLPRRLRAAIRVITGSEWARRDVIDAYGLAGSRVVVIPYGVDARFFESVFDDWLTTKAREVMLFPGAPVKRKNLEAVLKCMAEARADSHLGRACLEISGALPEGFPFQSALVRSLGLQSRVRWLGQVPAEAMPAVIRRADLVIYPSLSEGFGFAALEALAVGTPVVASNRGSLPEVLGDAALLVDPADLRALSESLEATLGVEELRERLRRAGRERASNYTWARCADKTVRLYSEILAGISNFE